jgi:hemerythrin
MTRAAYDQLSPHKADHERLLDALREIMDSAEDRRERSAEKVTAVLEAWFTDHFRTHDARLHQRLGPHEH